MKEPREPLRTRLFWWAFGVFGFLAIWLLLISCLALFSLPPGTP